jgi:threonine/homoserine/homoserine lactone efflux protein
MGIKLWTPEPIVPDLQPVSERRCLLPLFATGVALNLGNPKMPLLYVARLRMWSDRHSPPATLQC